jgi:hypothetical protein
MDSNNNKISRSDFLISSGWTLGGIAALMPLSCTVGIGFEKELLIAGQKGYMLVIPQKANAQEIEAANKLQLFLSKTATKKLQIIGEQDHQGQNAIYLGDTNFAKIAKINSKILEAQAYLFQRVDSNFVLAGGSENGLLNGVYSLLESFGFRKFSADDPPLIPQATEFLWPEDRQITPLIKYRTTSYYDARDEEYADWHKLSSRDSWGLFVHTFELLVPPEKYAKTHPEFYSLIDGERNPVTQLCLSNEEVFRVLVADLKKRIEKNPKAKYWSVSQNDNDKCCQCKSCTALNKKYGDVPSGSMLWFVNKVAEQFPDKIISTLAYWYTRVAPKNIVAAPNVNIMLCNIESTRERPVFETDPAFTRDLQDWGRISQDLLIWDYNIQFANPVSPFPNLHTIGSNIKFYIQNNVRALFMQATGNKGEFGHLRAYLITKLMWNPDADPKAVVDDFLEGYYGAAAPWIAKYIEIMRQALLRDDFQLNIFGDPRDAVDNYLSPEMMLQYHHLFDNAEKAVYDDEQKHDRVREVRLPLLIAEIQIAGQIALGQPGSFYEVNPQGRVVAKAAMREKVNDFISRSKKAGIQRIGERAITLDDYAYSFQRIFDKMEQMSAAISFRKKIIPMSPPSRGIEHLERLTDGIFGAFESWRFPDKDSNWVAFKGQHVDFVLDLGEALPIHTIAMDFLNVQAQANWHQLILPQFVTYALSDDGEHYHNRIKIVNPHNPNPAMHPDIVKIPFYSFSAAFSNVRARFIKVHAESVLQMPAWHINAGKPAFLYCDEIVVK